MPPMAFDMQKRELIVGDVTCLLCFCFYKQISAIILLPGFEGVLAPLHFNPVRFEEFASFAATLCGTWVGVALLLGAYQRESTSDIQTAAWRAFATWACAMPVAAAQLVLVTAAEDKALVGDFGFASVLPLAASGPGEPFTTAAGVLGLMAIWRCFYAAYIDIWNFRTPSGARVDRSRDGAIFMEALRAAALLAGCFGAAVFIMFRSIDEETAQQAISTLWRHR